MSVTAARRRMGSSGAASPRTYRTLPFALHLHWAVLALHLHSAFLRRTLPCLRPRTFPSHFSARLYSRTLPCALTLSRNLPLLRFSYRTCSSLYSTRLPIAPSTLALGSVLASCSSLLLPSSLCLGSRDAAGGGRLRADLRLHLYVGEACFDIAGGWP